MPAESIRPHAGGSVGTPSTHDWDSSFRRHVAKIVYHELLQATAPLSVGDLHEGTLLPEAEVRAAIAALRERGLCSERQRRGNRQPPRFVASNATGPSPDA